MYTKIGSAKAYISREARWNKGPRDGAVIETIRVENSIIEERNVIITGEIVTTSRGTENYRVLRTTVLDPGVPTRSTTQLPDSKPEEFENIT
jgi:hypothetical protein